MNDEMNAGELADALGLTFAEFYARNKRVGAYQANAALENAISEELEKSTRIAELMKKSGQTGRVGSEV